MIDEKTFNEACAKVIGISRDRVGIGTQSEKTLHLVLKNCFEPDESKHEVKIKRFIADIKNDYGITEIQTRAFNAMRKKLAFFLTLGNVRIVYPVPYEKNVIWIDPETGETSKPHKSPKKGSGFDIFAELYKIKPFLLDPRLSFSIVFLDMNEYKLLNGWSRDKKRGSTRHERIPTRYRGVLEIDSPDDYVKLIPEGLPAEFGSKDLAKSAHRTVYRARTALNVLAYVGAVELIGKNKRANVYEIKKTPPDHV